MSIKTIPVKFWSSASEAAGQAVTPLQKPKLNKTPTNNPNQK